MKKLMVIQEHDAVKAGLHWDLRFEKEHTDKNHTWLQMRWVNPCGKMDKNTTGEGIEGIVADLRLLNENESEKKRKQGG